MKTAILNWFGRFRKRSWLAQLSDIIFLLLIITVLLPRGRQVIQEAIIFTGIMQPSVSFDSSEKLSDQAYYWRLYSHTGTPVSLAAFKDKVIFINFWATWCPPCIAEMGSIYKLYQSYRNNPKIAFLMVTNDDVMAVRRFMKQRNFDFPVYYSASAVPQQLDSDTIPITFLMDSKHHIVIRKRGAADWNTPGIHDTIQALLSAAP